MPRFSLVLVSMESTRTKLDCMASAALSMRLARARCMACGSAMTGGRSRWRWLLDADTGETSMKERDGAFDDGIEIGGARVGGRELGEDGKLIDERAHAIRRKRG